jgi:hypothetical protein
VNKWIKARSSPNGPTIWSHSFLIRWLRFATEIHKKVAHSRTLALSRSSPRSAVSLPRRLPSTSNAISFPSPSSFYLPYPAKQQRQLMTTTTAWSNPSRPAHLRSDSIGNVGASRKKGRYWRPAHSGRSTSEPAGRRCIMSRWRPPISSRRINRPCLSSAGYGRGNSSALFVLLRKLSSTLPVRAPPWPCSFFSGGSPWTVAPQSTALLVSMLTCSCPALQNWYLSLLACREYYVTLDTPNVWCCVL